MCFKVTNKIVLGVKCFRDEGHTHSLCYPDITTFRRGEAMEVVVVLGASSDPTRYSFRAMQMLENYGHRPIPIHPRETDILGKPVVPSIQELVKRGDRVDTVTVYVNSQVSAQLEKDLVALKPARVIFNPGAENPSLSKALEKNGIKVEDACTLVLLQTNQF